MTKPPSRHLENEKEHVAVDGKSPARADVNMKLINGSL